MTLPYVHEFAEMLPVTLPAKALSNVLQRNVGFSHPSVQIGLVVNLAWICLTIIFICISAKFKRFI